MYFIRGLIPRVWGWVCGFFGCIFRDSITFFTSVLAAATVFLALATSELAKITKQERTYHARDYFDAALDEAEKCCQSCPTCASPYLMNIPIDKAVRCEHEASALLTAAEYNQLARLGSKVLDFPTTEGYIKKAMETDSKPLDKFFSYLVLGHIHFTHLKSDSKSANLEAARDNFKKATDALNTGEDTARFYKGHAWGLWAIHESVLKNSVESQTYYEFAKVSWSGLPEYNELVRNLFEQIEDAASNNIEPDIACLFKPNQPGQGRPVRCTLCSGEGAPTAPKASESKPKAPVSEPTPALKEPGTSAPKPPREVAVLDSSAPIPSKEVAAFDVSEFFRLMHSISSDDVKACQEFRNQWNNQTICWRVNVKYITQSQTGSGPYMTVTQVTTSAPLSTSTGIVAPLEQPIYVSRVQVPSELQQVFDVLKLNDKLLIEGVIQEGPMKEIFIVPSKIIRVR